MERFIWLIKIVQLCVSKPGISMQKIALSTFFICMITVLFGQVELRYLENRTLTYQEVIEAYRAMDSQFENALLLEFGPTDSGRPLHVFCMSSDKLNSEGNPKEWRKDKTVLLVNNGIHPGESCGIDASIAFARQMLQQGVPDDVLIAIIPVYNIGGALNRGCCSRANQEGPEEHGFRGNTRNLDLNRDFIKADALNTLSFYAIFHQFNPHVFIDTHTSNGADYQYTMTLISTQKDKLNPVLATYLTQKLEPALYDNMEKRDWPVIPYVNVFGGTPDKGYAAFLETPRYASGYTALFNTLGFITETHMLKPYKDRVESTLAFLHVMTSYMDKNAEDLKQCKKSAEAHDQKLTSMDIQWELDSSQSHKMAFKGFKASYIPSKVTTGTRLKYDRSSPVDLEINYYDSYKSIDAVRIPEYYVVPAAWHRVPQLLQYNGVKMKPLKSDTILRVESEYITHFDFAASPYEGHFPLQTLQTERRIQQRVFRKGDYLVQADQPARRFIVSVLEPTAADSYLRWNFYDEIFQQKEHFSAYVFEDTAEQLLKDEPELRTKYEEWLKSGGGEDQDPYRQLNYIYQHSEAYEKEHLRYPVARLIN